LFPTESYNFSINWGDGTNLENVNLTANFSTNLTHNYDNQGEYYVQIVENITKGFPRIYFNNTGDKRKVLEIKKWGNNTWKNFSSAFYGCSNLKITATDEVSANTSEVISLNNAWRNCLSMISFPSMNFSSCNNLSNAWNGCSSLENFGELNLIKGEIFDSSWANCGEINNFASYNFEKMLSAEDCFLGSSISSKSYSTIINYLASNNGEYNIKFDAGLSICGASAQESYNYLIGLGWEIIDGTNGNFDILN
jgi:hypothetical protein